MRQQDVEHDSEPDIRRWVVDIVAAYVSSNTLPAPLLPELINSVIRAMQTVEEQAAPPKAEPLKPPISIRKSVTPEYIICLEDGRKLKMLKRHLRTTYNMSPADYRAKWGLPAEYPMVAPNYAARRSQYAKKLGLGRQAGERPKRGRAGK